MNPVQQTDPKAMPPDDLNRTLLTLLREDARAKYAELGRTVHLSPPAVFERVKKLEKSGTILRYTVDLDPKLLELSLCAFVQIRILDDVTSEEVAERLTAYREVEECHSIAGDDCLLTKVRTTDAAALNRLLLEMKKLPGVQRTLTTIVLSTHFERGIQP
jgi:Lrp/AsnC family transcriptional regulator, leucine-responsive regulatory protein